MSCIVQVLLSASFLLSLCSCRASFEDIERLSLASSGENLEGKTGDSKAARTDETPILENTKTLPPEESSAYDCDGTVIIHEKGRDRNRDTILQPTEVSEVATECKAKSKDAGDSAGDGKDPGSDGKYPSKPTGSKDCPGQSKSKGHCPNDPGQNNPGQS